MENQNKELSYCRNGDIIWFENDCSQYRVCARRGNWLIAAKKLNTKKPSYTIINLKSEFRTVPINFTHYTDSITDLEKDCFKMTYHLDFMFNNPVARFDKIPLEIKEIDRLMTKISGTKDEMAKKRWAKHNKEVISTIETAIQKTSEFRQFGLI